MKVSFEWSSRREGNDGYVLERSGTGNGQEFGPMPCHLVIPFIEARRRLVAMRAEAAKLSYVEPDPVDWSTIQ